MLTEFSGFPGIPFKYISLLSAVINWFWLFVFQVQAQCQGAPLGLCSCCDGHRAGQWSGSQPRGFIYCKYSTMLFLFLIFICQSCNICGSSSFVCALQLASGVDQLIADYEIKDGHVLLQIDSVCYPFPHCKHCFYSLQSFRFLWSSSIRVCLQQVPAHKFLCVGFRISELFQVGMLNPATFTVYEYHAPGVCSSS